MMVFGPYFFWIELARAPWRKTCFLGCQILWNLGMTWEDYWKIELVGSWEKETGFRISISKFEWLECHIDWKNWLFQEVSTCHVFCLRWMIIIACNLMFLQKCLIRIIGGGIKKMFNFPPRKVISLQHRWSCKMIRWKSPTAWTWPLNE